MKLAKRFLKAIIGKLFIVYTTHKTGMVSLTFDDGPTKWTNEIVDTLAHHDSRASFFVLGKRIEDNKSTLSRIVENGSELCNHSWSHSYMNQLNYPEIKAEFDKVDQFILSHQNYSKFIRPPFGQISIKLLLFSLLNRKKIVLWSKTLGGDMKVNRVTVDQIKDDLASMTFENGDIILLHDTNEDTAKALPSILTHLHARGLKSVTLNELLS